MKKNVYLLFFIAVFCWGCNIINPKEPVPTFLHIEPFQYSNPDSSFTGSSSHSIPAAKVFINNSAVGVFDLPCTVPLIMSKDEEIFIIPAVTNQGLKSYVIAYPFYELDSVAVKHAPGQTFSFTPKTRYLHSLTRSSFRQMINFEEGNLFRTTGGDTGVQLITNPDLKIEGKYSGYIYVDQNHRNSESVSTNYFALPTSDCWLELEYKCSVPFQIGFRAEDANNNSYEAYSVGFYPKSETNKVYVNVSNFTNANTQYSRFYLKIRVSLDDDDGKYTEGYVVLDNFKVIYK